MPLEVIRIHGANRLGGNLAEILIFGKISGFQASERSLKMDIQYRSRAVIKKAHDKIDSLIKNGNEALVLATRVKKCHVANCV